MNARVRLDDTGELPNAQRKSSFLKGTLHNPTGEEAEVAALVRGATVGELAREGLELGLVRDDDLAELDQACDCLRLGDGNLRAAPRRRPPRVLVLHEDVAAPNLVRLPGICLRINRWFGRHLPYRFLGNRVVVVNAAWVRSRLLHEPASWDG